MDFNNKLSKQKLDVAKVKPGFKMKHSDGIMREEALSSE